MQKHSSGDSPRTMVTTWILSHSRDSRQKGPCFHYSLGNMEAHAQQHTELYFQDSFWFCSWHQQQDEVVKITPFESYQALVTMSKFQVNSWNLSTVFFKMRHLVGLFGRLNEIRYGKDTALPWHSFPG